MFLRTFRFASIGALFVLLSLPAAGQPTQTQPDWLQALRQGGHVIVFRHGATHADQADTDPLNPKNVAQQRQLNDSGRALATSIGESWRKLKIPVGDVYTSLFKRAVDTGTLMGFGEVKPTADVTEGGLVVTPNENKRREQALRALAARVPPPGTNVVIVSHKPNIMDAFGKDWFDLREGEASLFKPDGNGGTNFVTRVRVEEWGKLAGGAN
jgi:broad specificity phosphatase PhoE